MAETRISNVPGGDRKSSMSNSSAISLLCKHCIACYQDLCDKLQSITVDEGKKRNVDRELSMSLVSDAQMRFKAWAVNIAALHHGHMQSSLDYRLRDSSDIRQRLLKILAGLQESLRDAAQVASGEAVNETWEIEQASDSEDEHEVQIVTPVEKNITTSDLEQLILAIKNANKSLLKISMVVRNSPARDDYLKAAARYKFNAQYDIGHVKEKHGSAKRSSDWLLERLGKAITRRRQYLKYREDHHSKLTKNWDTESKIPEEVQQEEVNRDMTVALTKATTFVDASVIVGVEIANEHDADGSLGSQTSYEATEAGRPIQAEARLTVPPHPKTAFEGIPFQFGEPFQCPYCYTEQIVNNRAAWKKHVFRDLKPYVCTYNQCELRMFQSRNEWFAHERQLHRREWQCPHCALGPYTTRPKFTDHLIGAHSLHLGPQLDALILQCEEPVDKISASACLLCDEWETEMLASKHDARRLFLNNGNDVEPYGTIKQFRRHLGRHMEQLALFSLPMHDSTELEDDSPNEEDGIDDNDDDDEVATDDEEKSMSSVEASREHGKDEFTIHDRKRLSSLMRRFAASNITWEELESSFPGHSSESIRMRYLVEKVYPRDSELSPAQIHRYRKLYWRIKDGKGDSFISKSDYQTHFRACNSNLFLENIIWVMVDTKNHGFLSRAKFFTACHLIELDSKSHSLLLDENSWFWKYQSDNSSELYQRFLRHGLFKHTKTQGDGNTESNLRESKRSDQNILQLQPLKLEEASRSAAIFKEACTLVKAMEDRLPLNSATLVWAASPDPLSENLMRRVVERIGPRDPGYISYAEFIVATHIIHSLKQIPKEAREATALPTESLHLYYEVAWVALNPENEYSLENPKKYNSSVTHNSVSYDEGVPSHGELDDPGVRAALSTRVESEDMVLPVSAPPLVSQRHHDIETRQPGVDNPATATRQPPLSLPSSHRYTKPSSIPEDEEMVITVPDLKGPNKGVALYAFQPASRDELPLFKGQTIDVIHQPGEEWLLAVDPQTLRRGWVPRQYVRLLAEEKKSHGASQRALHFPDREDTGNAYMAFKDANVHRLKSTRTQGSASEVKVAEWLDAKWTIRESGPLTVEITTETTNYERTEPSHIIFRLGSEENQERVIFESRVNRPDQFRLGNNPIHSIEWTHDNGVYMALMFATEAEQRDYWKIINDAQSSPTRHLKKIGKYPGVPTTKIEGESQSPRHVEPRSRSAVWVWYCHSCGQHGPLLADSTTDCPGCDHHHCAQCRTEMTYL